MRKYLHDYDALLEGEVRRLKAAPISKGNRDLILRFNDYNYARDLSKARIIRNSCSLRITAQRVKKDFGLVQDSKMAARYVHLSGKQVDDAILRLHG